ncbi:aminotransferase class I/II-fold pyridoxal phosphate-dependent enzyme [Longispora albida]|uniref:aminotransferase class I/II-fold pyridoxal phosphate-dependent enzyme n=1 Tax=Longispora albida TaxID=203523 RepID=UPI000360F039|nr:aminotransferase class I/II-fold pyridoxal phosphate-dependent enzyme [Longispora albida]
MHANHPTPLADALCALGRRDVASFHALPLSGGRSVHGSALRGRFEELYGAHLAADVSYSAPVLDSLFAPRGPLRAAQRLAAEAFGADATLFVSAGSCVSNAVAVRTLVEPGSRVLADRTCHQSIHFALDAAGATVDYAPVRPCGCGCPAVLADLAALLDMARAEPYPAVVLSAASYDGVLYDLPALLRELAATNPSARVIVDEAWGAINAFHPELAAMTALRGARDHRGLTVAVTHSAHKSMSALRQGSYLHFAAAPETLSRARAELFRLHTTSPSFPILASLDLARAHAQRDGAGLVARSIRLAAAFREAISTDPSLAVYRLPGTGASPAPYARHDPAKVLVDAGMPGEEFRRLLFEEHDVYAARHIGTAVLFSFHIGVDEVMAARLLAALRALALPRPVPEPGSFVIPYPPGIPAVLPGEDLDPAVLAALRTSGCELFVLPGHGRRQPRAPKLIGLAPGLTRGDSHDRA